MLVGSGVGGEAMLCVQSVMYIGGGVEFDLMASVRWWYAQDSLGSKGTVSCSSCAVNVPELMLDAHGHVSGIRASD